MATMGGENDRPARRRRSRESGVSAVFMAAASAALGAFIAVLTDITVKEEASAIIKISTICNRNLGLGLQTYWWALLVVNLGVALCMVYEPDTKPRAFGIGASIVALIATATPHKVNQNTPPVETVVAVIKEAQLEPSWHNANFFIGNKSTELRSERMQNIGYSYAEFSRISELALTIRAQGPFRPSEARLTFYRPDIDQTVRDVIFLRESETRVSIKFPTYMMQSHGGLGTNQRSMSQNQLYVRVEADGYHLFETTVPLDDLSNQKVVDVNLSSSFFPTPIDKLLRSYKY